MSNKVILESKEFKAGDGTVTYGYTLSDDYANGFNDCAESRIEDDLNLLAYAIENHTDEVGGILDSVQESEKGMLINDTWYEWSDIKHLWN